MSYLAVTNWAKYQHYRNRKPAWVKFYVTLADPNHPLNDQPVATRYVFDRMLLLAAEWNNAIPNDSELIAKLLRMPPGDCREALDQLLKGRWIKEKQTRRTASKPARGSLPPELEKEKEKERSTQPVDKSVENQLDPAAREFLQRLNITPILKDIA